MLTKPELDAVGILTYNISDIPPADVIKQRTLRRAEFHLANLRLELRLIAGKLEAVLLSNISEIARINLRY